MSTKLTKKQPTSNKWKKIKKTLFNLIPVFIIAGGVFYYFFPAEYWLANHLKNNTPIERLSTPKDNSLDAKNVNSPEKTAIPDYGNENQLEANAGNLFKASQVDYVASGGIYVPKSGIRLPIYHGIGNYTMLKGAGEQYDTSIVTAGGKGNYVLASHRTPYQGYLFTELHRVGKGDEFYVVGSDTNMIYQYKVDWTEVVEPNQDSAIQQDEAKTTSETTEETTSVKISELTSFAEKKKGAVSLTSKSDIDYNTGKETKTETTKTIISIDNKNQTAKIKETTIKTTNKYLCTLYTCTDNYATHRLVVRSHLSAVIPAEEASQELLDVYSGWFSGTL